MSPRRIASPPPPRVRALAARLSADLGREIRGERLRRRWTLAALAGRAGISVSMLHGVEEGRPTSPEGYARIALALDLQPSFTLQAPRVTTAARAADPVHAAIGEIEAERFRGFSFQTRLDEPYQHFHYAGRADLIAFAPRSGALLHIENRTRFPDIQGFAGSFNAKRQYLATEIAPRFGVPRFTSLTHVIVALWSAEVLHVLRIRTATFRSLAPEPPDAFAGWWIGEPPRRDERISLVVFDPLPGRRATRRQWIGLDDVRRVEPRYRDYADALAALRSAGRA